MKRVFLQFSFRQGWFCEFLEEGPSVLCNSILQTPNRKEQSPTQGEQVPWTRYTAQLIRRYPMGNVPSTSISTSSPPLRFKCLIERFGDLARADDITPEVNNGYVDE
jgi:hypothetical protein